MKNIKRLLSCTLIALFVLPAFAEESEDGYRLQDVTVKGEKREAAKVEKASTSTVITGEEIEEKNIKLLKEVLVNMPGISVQTQRKGTTTFTMRGYGMNKVALLVDGIPVFEPFSGSMDINNIGLQDVSDMIITRGTCSALYGVRGAVGSINIIKAAPVKPYIKAGVEFDHLFNRTYSASHGNVLGDFYYMISGSFSRSKGYEVSGKLTKSRRIDWLRQLSRYYMFGFNDENILTSANESAYYVNDTGRWDHVNHAKYKSNAKMGYKITDTAEIGINAFYNHSRMCNSTYHVGLQDIYKYTNATTENPSGLNWVGKQGDVLIGNQASRWPKYDDYSVSLYGNYAKDNFSLKANVFYYGQDNKYVSFDNVGENMANNDIIYLTWSIWNTKTYGLNILPSYKFSENNKLNMALTYYTAEHIEKEQAYSERSTNITDNYGTGKYKTLSIKADYITLAAEDEIKIGDMTDLSIGVSYDAQNLREFKKLDGVKSYASMTDRYKAKNDHLIWGTRDCFNPVVAAIIEPMKDFLKLRTSASYKNTFPSLQAYSNTKSPYAIGANGATDKKIKPEKSINGNIGGEVMLLDGQLTIGADYFYTKFFDKITRSYETWNTNDYVYRNLDSTFMSGTETVIRWNPQEFTDIANFSAGFTHTFLYARNNSKVKDSTINRGKRIEETPEHKFTLDFKTHFCTNTSLYIFGSFEYDQVIYAMKYRPSQVSSNQYGRPYGMKQSYFTRDCWEAVQLNNPFMLDVKLSQIFSVGEAWLDSPVNVEAYIMCKNIFDDYLANPLNPGPGRTWCFGVKAAY